MAGLRDDLRELLEGVRAGTTSPDDALERLSELPYRDLGFARVDLHRELRQGAPEAVLAEGKTPEQVARDLRRAARGRRGKRARDARRRRGARGRPRGRARRPRRTRSRAASGSPAASPSRAGSSSIVSAGTSDGPVVREVRIRAELLGTTVVVHEDVGVAGVHRLATALPDLERADCVVVVAGMDGALASLVGGLARGPVIGVPTSVGYGSAHGGTTALNAMLASCAAGLAVVGIDDGLGAGTIAARIARGRE